MAESCILVSDRAYSLHGYDDKNQLERLVIENSPQIFGTRSIYYDEVLARFGDELFLTRPELRVCGQSKRKRNAGFVLRKHREVCGSLEARQERNDGWTVHDEDYAQESESKCPLVRQMRGHTSS